MKSNVFPSSPDLLVCLLSLSIFLNTASSSHSENALRSKIDCYEENGEMYRGEASVTDKGSSCEPWTNRKAPVNMFTTKGKGLGEHNFCRNPDGDQKPWCWVDANNGLFGFCAIKRCIRPTTPNPSETVGFAKMDCESNEFYCPSLDAGNGGCVNQSAVCNALKDCPNSEDEDEELCSTICKSTQFLCRRAIGVSRCLPQSVKCDRRKHCPDGEDEEHCQYQGGPLDFFKPKAKRRLLVRPREYRNLTMKQCADMCRRSASVGLTCLSFNFLPANSHMRVSFKESSCEILRRNLRQAQGYYIVDSHSIYFEFSDDCASGLGGQSIKCKNSRCIAPQFRCDGKDDCGDNTDEDDCKPKPHSNNVVRLVGGRGGWEGRLEVLHLDDDDNLLWKPVCNPPEIDDAIASVICHQLGFKGLGRFVEKSLVRFGRSRESKWLALEHECSGMEGKLDGCKNAFPVALNSMLNDTCEVQNIAGVLCAVQRRCEANSDFRCVSTGNCIDILFVCDDKVDCRDGSDERNCKPKLSLHGGKDELSGRVIIERNGISGSICDDDFDDKDAFVICRMMGIAGEAKAFTDGRFGNGSAKEVIWLDNLQCQGNESDVSDCPNAKWLRSDCSHAEDVGIQCGIFQTTTAATSTTTVTTLRSTTITSTVATPTTTPDYTLPPLKPMPMQCGLRFIQPPRSPRHLGSYEAAYGEFPWQVGIRRKVVNYGSEHWCGGTVINDLWILSAAHCFKHPKEDYTVRIGDWDNSKQDSDEQHFTIDRLFIHPNWTGAPLYDNDIAMIKIKTLGRIPIKFSHRIQPACLPELHEKRSSVIRCHISGWGSRGGHMYPSKLLAADVPFITDTECYATYGNRLTSNMQCAGFLHGGVDACQGDSGGPLVCRTGSEERYVLWGITSWGEGCAKPDNPGVYTRVNRYLKWISVTIRDY